jgi:hypothetical protein
MAIEKIINVIVKEKGTDLTIAKTDKLKGKLSQLNQTTGSLTKGLGESSNAILENGGAMGLLNELTGGLAMTVKDAVEATGLFTSGTTIATLAQKAYTFVVGTTTGALKALRLAIASTGIGLLVVAIGYLVSSMMSAGDATEEETRAQEALNKALENGKKAFDDLNEGIDYATKLSVLRAKIAGKSEQELSKIENDANDERRVGFLANQKRLEDALYNEKSTPEQKKKIQEELTKNDDSYYKGLRQNEVETLEGKLKVADEDRAKTAEANQKRLDAQKEYRENQRKLKEEQDKKDADDLKTALENQAKSEAEVRQNLVNEIDIAREKNNAFNLSAQEKELQDIDDRYFVLIERAKEFGLSTEELLTTQLNERNDINKKFGDIDSENNKKKADKDIAIEKAIAEQKAAIQNAQFNLADKAVGFLNVIAGKNKALQKASIIAENALAIGKSIIATNASNIAAIAQGNALAIPTAGASVLAATALVTTNNIGLGLGIATTVAATAKALSALGGGSGGGGSAPTSGGGSGSATPSAPSFNVVGGTNSNQIAESLGGQNRPIQAFVVSSAVTSGQELDRNAQNRASI